MMNTRTHSQPEKEHLGRSFGWHNATQFLGALNDNIFQGLMIFFVIGLVGLDKAPNVSAVAGIIFVVPFLLLTPYAGILADRFSKRNIIVLTKLAELAIMALGTAMFLAGGTLGQYGIYTVLFLMCTQSAFFGPCKYGIIPELVRTEQLSKANSFLEGLTYLSIVLGSAAAPFLAESTGQRFAAAGLACVLISAAGVACSLRIGPTPPLGNSSHASVFFFRDIAQTFGKIKHDKELVLVILANAYFMLLGGFAKVNLIPYGVEVCNATAIQSGYLFVTAAVGIGVGSFLAGKLSRRSIEFGIVPLGAVGMALSSIGLGLLRRQTMAPAGWLDMIRLNPGLFFLITVFGVSAGLFIVPIHSFIQMKAPRAIRGQVVAAANFLGWCGVALASLLIFVVCGMLGVPSQWMFVGLGTATLVLAVVTVWILPDFLVRLFVVLITRSMYRIRCRGLEHVPAEGPALLVSNHVSWADPVLLLATQPRRIRFVMDKAVYRSRWFHWLFRLARVIPISAADSPKKIVAALEEARAAMEEGSLVCIFAEGTITRTGMLGRFRSGFEKILRGTDYQIVPVYLGGVWGSILSHYYGPLLSAWPRKIPYPVSVHFGKPLPAETSADEIRGAIEELSVDYFDAKKPARPGLGQTFVRAARRHWGTDFMSDTTGKRLTWGRALIGAVALGDKIKARTEGQGNLGIFLPPSVGGALANLATALLGKTAVNLSYTASESDRRYMIEQAEIQTILTSRGFLEKLDLPAEAVPGAVFLEDILASLTAADKRTAWLKARFLPRGRLAHARDFQADQTAAILFSSGSSGRPKGILLSHHNILSNLEAALMIFRVQRGDKLCGILPFFHSFGLTCTLWLPILAGVPVCFVPNPLDGKLVGRTVRDEKATLLFATPTFLLNYLRRCEAEDFKTLRFIIAGAEKLKVKMIDAFEKKFGIRPREGYGATECSPLISFNVIDAEVAGVRQVGTKEGTAGHPLPGLAVRIVDPETGEPLPVGQPGLLWVKGPNVMKGYLNLPDKTAQALRDGWYNTGDIVTLDRDGFLTITDRLSRFSKIGGEMVPHLTLEETCMQLLGLREPAVAVTSLPDEKKGEQLILIVAKDKVDPDRLYEKLADSDLPKLYVPKRENILPVDEIPVLGSGKLDLFALRTMAESIKKAREQSS